MKLRNSFSSMFLLLTAFAVIGGIFSGFSFLHSEVQKPVVVPLPSPTVFPTLVPTRIPKPSVVYPSNRFLPSPTPKSSFILFRIDDHGSSILDSSLSLKLKNETTGKEETLQNTSSNWVIAKAPSGTYRLSISFPTDRYVNMEKSCDGCVNKKDISSFDICGYIFDYQQGNSVKIYCELRTTHPLSAGQTSGSQSNSSDTTPPTTNVSYPQQNGSITYKIDGKVCAIATAPTDNSNPQEIETEYVFDNGNWSGYATGRGYLCIDTLPNGPHTLSYHSKDKAGNVENTQTRSFTVNIDGN